MVVLVGVVYDSVAVVTVVPDERCTLFAVVAVATV